MNLKELLAAEAAKLNLGATGEKPVSGIAGDQGGLKCSLRVVEGNLILNFGANVSWVAMTPQEAIEFANTLTRLATNALAAHAKQGAKHEEA